ncbi:CatB-related O-acetyltransferase [Roseobacter sp. HKCCA0434]|uniref:CatB-related O-acetyltransferase n=1 Tax=Roseobacter sp. HKCCA0434 TaxID=3079297 RepID=UPI002905827F|nr:CatB-related O-acetyltransferase [Roseobacter sp. HKCCA0434]
MTGPDPDTLHPMPSYRGATFLRPLAGERANVEIGEYAYYDDRHETGDFFDRNVLQHYDFIGDRLVIGRFCALAYGVQIHMNGGTHAMGGFSTYPFNIFGGGWEEGFDPATWDAEHKGDTVIGPDVWIGTEAKLMPGVTIGAGAIVAAHSVVTRDVRPYAVVGGNPARELRRRFDDETVERLLDIAWWDWPVEKISRNLDAIRGADLARLIAAE